MSQKFSLKCNDYQFNWCRALAELHRDKDYADVTLVTDDKVKFSAHKIVLSSCSNTFKFILKDFCHPIPLIYLNGISSVNLGFILEYIYTGEVNIDQEQLDSFFKSSEKLEIEGLVELLSGRKRQEIQEYVYSEENTELKEEEKEQESQENLYSEDNMELKEDLHYQFKEEKETTPQPIKRKEISREPKRAIRQVTNKKSVNKIDVSSMTPEEMSGKMSDLYSKIDGVWRCLACEYENKMVYKIKRHIEIHIDGLSYNCDLCHMNFRQKNLLDNHISCVHRK